MTLSTSISKWLTTAIAVVLAAALSLSPAVARADDETRAQDDRLPERNGLASEVASTQNDGEGDGEGGGGSREEPAGDGQERLSTASTGEDRLGEDESPTPRTWEEAARQAQARTSTDAEEDSAGNDPTDSDEPPSFEKILQEALQNRARWEEDEEFQAFAEAETARIEQFLEAGRSLRTGPAAEYLRRIEQLSGTSTAEESPEAISGAVEAEEDDPAEAFESELTGDAGAGGEEGGGPQERAAPEELTSLRARVLSALDDYPKALAFVTGQLKSRAQELGATLEDEPLSGFPSFHLVPLSNPASLAPAKVAGRLAAVLASRGTLQKAHASLATAHPFGSGREVSPGQVLEGYEILLEETRTEEARAAIAEEASEAARSAALDLHARGRKGESHIWALAWKSLKDTREAKGDAPSAALVQAWLADSLILAERSRAARARTQAVSGLVREGEYPPRVDRRRFSSNSEVERRRALGEYARGIQARQAHIMALYRQYRETRDPEKREELAQAIMMVYAGRDGRSGLRAMLRDKGFLAAYRANREEPGDPEARRLHRALYAKGGVFDTTRRRQERVDSVVRELYGRHGNSIRPDKPEGGGFLGGAGRFAATLFGAALTVGPQVLTAQRRAEVERRRQAIRLRREEEARMLQEFERERALRSALSERAVASRIQELRDQEESVRLDAQSGLAERARLDEIEDREREERERRLRERTIRLLGNTGGSKTQAKSVPFSFGRGESTEAKDDGPVFESETRTPLRSSIDSSGRNRPGSPPLLPSSTEGRSGTGAGQNGQTIQTSPGSPISSTIASAAVDSGQTNSGADLTMPRLTDAEIQARAASLVPQVPNSYGIAPATISDAEIRIILDGLIAQELARRNAELSARGLRMNEDMQVLGTTGSVNITAASRPTDFDRYAVWMGKVPEMRKAVAQAAQKRFQESLARIASGIASRQNASSGQPGNGSNQTQTGGGPVSTSGRSDGPVQRSGGSSTVEEGVARRSGGDTEATTREDVEQARREAERLRAEEDARRRERERALARAGEVIRRFENRNGGGLAGVSSREFLSALEEFNGRPPRESDVTLENFERLIELGFISVSSRAPETRSRPLPEEAEDDRARTGPSERRDSLFGR